MPKKIFEVLEEEPIIADISQPDSELTRRRKTPDNP